MPKKSANASNSRAKDLTEFAKHERAHCLAGIFIPKPRGINKKAYPRPLEVTYQENKLVEYEFKGRQCPGPFELAILQGLVALAGPNGIIFGEDTANETALKLWLDLGIQNQLFGLQGGDGGEHNMKSPDAILISTDRQQKQEMTYYRLLQEAGLSRQTKTEAIIDALSLLSEIKIFRYQYRTEEKLHYEKSSSNLLNFYINSYTKKLYVALNPYIARAFVMEDENISYVRINMIEARALSGNERILHQHLSAFINYGKTKKISLDKITSYIWPDYQHMEGENYTPQERKRRNAAKEATLKLKEIGWKIEEKKVGNGIFEITRPSLPLNKLEEKK